MFPSCFLAQLVFGGWPGPQVGGVHADEKELCALDIVTYPNVPFLWPVYGAIVLLGLIGRNEKGLMCWRYEALSL